MALGKCDYCTNRLSLGSAICKRCGRRKKRLKLFLASLVCVEALVIASTLRFPASVIVKLFDSTPAEPVSADPSPELRPQAGWFYFQTRDALIDDTMQHARVLSVNLADTPGRSGVVRATTGVLELRASPTYGSSVVITLKRRAFTLVDERCAVRAQFDGGTIVEFQASGSLDGDTAILALNDSPGFTAKLAQAHSLALEAVLSARVRRAASFAIGGLRWDTGTGLHRS